MVTSVFPTCKACRHLFPAWLTLWQGDCEYRILLEKHKPWSQQSEDEAGLEKSAYSRGSYRVREENRPWSWLANNKLHMPYGIKQTHLLLEKGTDRPFHTVLQKVDSDALDPLVGLLFRNITDS